MFIAVFSLCLCWAPVAAIVLNIIIPERRATAAGFQTFVSHLLGDAFSPLLIGFISDRIRGSDESDHAESLSLLYALYITCFAAAIGGGLFLISTFFIHHDYHQVELYVAEHRDNRNKLCHNVADDSASDDDSDDHPLVHSDYFEQPSVKLQ